MFNERSIFVIL